MINYKNKKELSELVKNKAISLGFSNCGISKARFLSEEKNHLETWLINNYHGEMSYLDRNIEKRLSPEKLVPGTKSIISVLLNYYPKEKQISDAPQISKYAYGDDYHDVLKMKLLELFEFIKLKTGDITGRVFVDSAPVLEKTWAKLSGLGWIGKNSNLITKKGSYFLLGELFINIELEYDNEIKNLCGNCTKCIDACPTAAIVKPYTIDSRKCISYLTIEYKNNLPENLKTKINNRLYGCDICMDVCPWNSKSSPHNITEFNIRNEIKNYTKTDWQTITQEEFSRIFRKSAVKRAKYKGFMRNLDFLD